MAKHGDRRACRVAPEPGVFDIAPAVREGSLDRYDGLFATRNGDGPADGPAPDGVARRMEGDAR